jgi:hypothetical protein
MWLMSVQWERKEQSWVVKWFRLKYPGVLIDASPNPGKMGMRAAGLMKAEGLLAGSPDIRVYKAMRGYHGLFIELKVDKTKLHAKGKLSMAQKVILAQLNAEGYHAVCCYGWMAAKEVIDWYLSGMQGNDTEAIG